MTADRLPDSPLPSSRDRTAQRTSWLWAGVIALVLGGLYWYTLLPVPGYAGDTAKFEFLGVLLGTPHEPGYPIYILLNHLFVQMLPWGSVAYRANLLSALFTLAAAITLYRIMRWQGVEDAVAALVTVSFGLGYTIWSQAEIAEVYPLYAVYVSLFILAAYRWHETHSDIDFDAACLVYALSFGNHLMVINLLPAFVYLVWAVDRRKFTHPPSIAKVAGFILLGASQYIFVFLRTASPATRYVEMAPTDLANFLSYVTGGQFPHLLFHFSVEWMVIERLPVLLLFIGRELLLLGPLVVLGWLHRPRTAFDGFSALGVLATLVFAMGYAIHDIFVYLVVLYIFAALYAARGVQWLMNRSRRPRVLKATLLIIPLVALGMNYDDCSLRQMTAGDERALEVLHDVGEHAIIICPNYEYAHILWYHVFIDGYGGRDIHVAYYHDHHWPVEEADRYVHERAPFPVAVTREMIPHGRTVYLYVRKYQWDISRFLMFRKTDAAGIQAWRMDIVNPWKRELQEHGLKMTAVNEDLYRIETAGT